MRIIVAAIGRLKEAEEQALCARYAKRIDGSGKGLGISPFDVIELSEARGQNTAQRKQDEADKLLKAITSADMVFALDETGVMHSSEAFASALQRHRDDGCKTCAFVIGGPDGHGPQILSRATTVLSLGKMTLPHGLARVILFEQLYRATTILAGHPYHRA